MRWRRYLLDGLIETTIARDLLLMTRVGKPALLRRPFELGGRDSGQVPSDARMLGQLHDAGNAPTVAHHRELLGAQGGSQESTPAVGTGGRGRHVTVRTAGAAHDDRGCRQSML